MISRGRVSDVLNARGAYPWESYGGGSGRKKCCAGRDAHLSKALLHLNIEPTEPHLLDVRSPKV